MLDDFELVSKNFPVLFTFGEMGYLKANILFSNGKEFCPYIINHQCSIYNQRPSICKNYPLSPNLDDKVYIDDSCPAVNTEFGSTIVNKGEVSNIKEHPTLTNYQNKFIETHLYLEQFNNKNSFEKLIEINNIIFYKYIGRSKDKYIETHLSSLKNFKY
ncbi:MAG: YkgJ family cysteine cluster protein [Campylobacterota bacterium]|nr:YkgJ family cysteine cluster protein [Campylobacterota bacterium]